MKRINWAAIFAILVGPILAGCGFALSGGWILALISHWFWPWWPYNWSQMHHDETFGKTTAIVLHPGMIALYGFVRIMTILVVGYLICLPISLVQAVLKKRSES